MEAKKSFEEILQHVESSQLNYHISKTPFSATISLKSSFTKLWNTAVKSDKDLLEDSEQETKVKKEVNEHLFEEQRNNIAQLGTTINILQQTIIDKEDGFEKHASKLKDAVKAAEMETEELREELLAIKQERKRVKAITQTLEQEIELLKVENKNMVKENLKLSENIKVIEAKVKELVKDKITLEEARGSLEPSNDTQCEFCDEEINQINDLKKHIREKHLVDKCVQLLVSQTQPLPNLKNINVSIVIRY